MFLTQERTSTSIVRKDPVLVVVEISSRKGYFRAMPDKTASTTAKALSSIINAIYEANQRINVLEHATDCEGPQLAARCRRARQGQALQ